MSVKTQAYLQRYSEIIKELSIKYDIPFKEVEFMIDYFFLTFKRFITNIWMPIIRITNLGTFKPTIGRLEWHIHIAINSIRRGHKNPEKVKERIRHYWIIRRRLIDERLGKSTWKEWRSKLKIEEVNDNQKESKKQKP